MTTQHTPDFDAIRARAREMTEQALLWSIQDCYEAAGWASEIEKAGCRVGKTEGYYTDEAAIYRAELNRREREMYPSTTIRAVFALGIVSAAEEMCTHFMTAADNEGQKFRVRAAATILRRLANKLENL